MDGPWMEGYDEEKIRAKYEEERAAILAHIAASARAVMGGGQAPASASAQAPAPAPSASASVGAPDGQLTAGDVGDKDGGDGGVPSLSASLDSGVVAAAHALGMDPDVSVRTSASDMGP